jgi:Subtilase family
MKRQIWLAGILVALLWAAPAKADNSYIVRSTLSLQALQTACNPPLLPSICTVVGGLGDPLGQLYAITSPLTLSGLQGLVGNPLGIVDVEVNQLLNLVGGLNVLPTPISPTLMQDRSSTPYPTGSTTQTAWNSYVNQPAASIVEVQNAQKTFNVTGTGIVADIDTGVDPTHPVLQPVLVPGDGYDFTRNQPGGSELNDIQPTDFPTYPPRACTSTTCPTPAQVNQSTAAVLDQSTAAVLDGNGTPNQYAAFGHGTMVMGIIHLVAPTAMLMPLKAFHSDGTASLSDILRAIYYGVQNGANVINMSFDTKTSSVELQKALDYANQQGVISAASAGNDGQGPPNSPILVYPAALQSDVMGVASTTNQDTRSSFSNYGSAIVWVAAPGEAIVSTYPFNTYAAGWGTSFSAPFVSGGAALLHNVMTGIGESGASTAVSHAVPLDASLGLNHGRLDLCMALGSVGTGSCSPDYSVSATPSTQTITAGQQASFTVSATPQNGSKQTVTWTCMVAPAGPNCTVSPQSVTLDGTNTASATVTLMTVARGLVTPTPIVLPRGLPLSHLWVTLAAFFAALAVLLMLCGLMSPSRRRPGLAAAAGLLAVSLWTYSCGGYGSPGGPGPGSGSPTLSSVVLNPMSVTGGTPSTGTVNLSGSAPSGGVAVSLSSSSSSATVPASVTVAYGASSVNFTVNTSAVNASTPVTITASNGGVNETATLTVVPQASSPTLSSVTLNPTSVTGGSSSMGTVTLSGSAPSGGAQVVLSSDNGAASVPTSVTVAAGATSATFTVTSSAVTTSTPVTISASYAGVTKTASLTVTPPGTAAGTYTLTITGTSGNVSHATTVQVIVN